MYRFTRAQRLTEASEYSALFKGRETQRASDGLITILARPNGLGRPRLGFAVGRKAVPRAVGRNRIKRQARELFRSRQGKLPALDFLVMARAPAATADRAHLRESLARHLTKVAERCAGSS